MNYILTRRRSPVEVNDLLHILLNAQYNDTGLRLTDDQVLNESVQLLVAAHETSSTALSWVMYLLCLNPKYLKHAVDEFEAVLGDGALQFSHLPALEFNMQVIDEALRLFPPFWMVDRVAMADDEAADLFIPKGTMVIAFIYGTHYAPEYWEEPTRFYPERFSKENKTKQPAYTYLPFGAGPRGCIGANYARLQMLMVLSEILRRYRFSFSIVPGASIEMGPRIILRSRNVIPMTFARVHTRH
jgi:cytochrome P450